jgi:hypothetical protein
MKRLTVEFTSWASNPSITSRWKIKYSGAYVLHRVDGPAVTIIRTRINYKRREWWKIGRLTDMKLSYTGMSYES